MARHNNNVDLEDYSEEVSDQNSETGDAVDALLTPESGRSRKKLKVADSDSSQPRRHRRQSEVWRFYDRHPDHAKTCKVCQKHFSTNTATGALRKHLEKHFGEQTDQVLSTAQSAMEVTISPATNTVTVSGLAPITSAAVTTTPSQEPATPPPPPKVKRLAPKTPHPPVATLSVGPNSSTVTGTALPMKARYKSAVWSYFFRHEDGRPQCRTCGKIYSTTASTSGLQRHIDHHDRVHTGIPMPSNGLVKVEPSNSAAPLPPNLPSFPATPANSTPILKSKLITKNFASYPNGEEYFLRTALQEHIPIREIIDQLHAVYRNFTGKFPEVTALEARLQEWYFRKREVVKRFLQELNSRVSISLELWTSATDQTYLIVTAHVMSEKWEPLRFVLDCVLVSPDLLPEYMKDLLTTVLTDFEIFEKVLAVTTGNEKVMEAFNAFKVLVSLKPGPPVSHVKCIGWGLTVCVQPALDHVQEHINKVRRFLKTVLNHRKTAELQSTSALLLHDYQEIKLDFPGMWSSTVAMLDDAVKMRPVIDDFINRNGEAYGEFTEDEWRVLELTVELVNNFQMAAMDIGKSDYPALSNVLPLMEYLTAGLGQQKDSQEHPAWWRKLAKEMLDRTTQVMQSLFSDVYFFGTVLDPRHKLSTIPTAVNRQGIEENLRTVFARYLQPVNSAEMAIANTGSAGKFQAGSLMSAILKKNRESLTQPNIDELNQYLNTAVEQPDVDPLEWWDSHRKVYPHLALMAKDYICIPATSIPSDQLFDKEKRAGRWRNRLDEAELLQYVCLNSWSTVDLSSRIGSSFSTVASVVKKEAAA